MQQQLRRIDPVYIGCIGSLILLAAFKGGDLLQGIQAQSIIARNAQASVKDAAIAEQRFSLGCNTGFLTDGKPTLVQGAIATDARTGTPLAPGALLCDVTGATAIVGSGGEVTDLRVSARVRKTYLENNLGVK